MEPIGGPKGKRKGKIKKAESESENEVRPRSKIRKNAEEMDGKQIAGGSQMCKNKDLETQLGSRPNLRKKMKDPIFKEALERKFYEYTEEYGEYPDSLQMMELVEEEMEDEILMREVSKELNNGKHRKWAEEMIIEEPSDEGKPEEEWESTKKTRKPKEKIVNERVKVQNRFESLSELDSDEEEPKMEEKTVKAKTPPVVVDGQPKNHQQFISENAAHRGAIR